MSLSVMTVAERATMEHGLDGIEEAFVQEGQLRRLSLGLRACRDSLAFTIARIVGTPTAKTIAQPGSSSSSGSAPR